jgi:sulfite exporter TauE/SafE
MSKIIISLFLTGLLFGWGPCLASCGPLLICYVAGTGKNIGKGLKTYVIFSASRICAYVILSLLIFFLGRFMLERFLGEYSKYVYILGGAFIIFVGFIMVLGKHLNLGFLNKIKKNILERDTKSLIIFGLIAGFLPCAPLIAVLSYVGLISKNWYSSLSYGLSFGLGTFLSPLILLVMITGLIPKLVAPNAAIYYRVFNIICGLVIIFLGIQLAYKGI